MRAQNSFISVLRNSCPLSDLSNFGIVLLLNMSLEKARRTSTCDSALHGSIMIPPEMQHRYDRMNLFPCASSGCIGPSKSTATSSQHSSQEGFTATESCLTGLFLFRIQTRHFSAYWSRSACIAAHQQTFLNTASIFAPLRCPPKIPVWTCLQQNSFQLMSSPAFPEGTIGTQISPRSSSFPTILSRRPSSARRNS